MFHRVVGCPKEIKRDEYRVAITPSRVKLLTSQGVDVLIGKNAGLDSGFYDEDYKTVGAYIVQDSEVYQKSQIILKVAPPQDYEIDFIRSDHIVFGSFKKFQKSVLG